MTKYGVFLTLLAIVGCRAEAVEQMAHAAKQIDETFSLAYMDSADDCRENSRSWEEYDRCLADWEAAADAVIILHNTTLALDTTLGRKPFKEAACGWYRAVAVVDALSPVELPAAKPALVSRWRRRC